MSSMNRLLDWKGLAADYGQYHRDRRNRLCHAIGIPLIVLCVVRWTQPAGSAIPLAAAVLPLYVYWDAALGLAMAAAMAGMAALAPLLPAWAFPALFSAGWIFQFVGHRYEGRSPAFTKNALHLLVGPLWVLRETTVALFLH
jgi:uncharacterized membrane protein YGL010W